MGYADPEIRLGYGYVTNRMGMHLQGDPRDLVLRAAIPSASRASAAKRRSAGAKDGPGVPPRGSQSLP